MPKLTKPHPLSSRGDCLVYRLTDRPNWQIKGLRGACQGFPRSGVDERERPLRGLRAVRGCAGGGLGSYRCRLPPADGEGLIGTQFVPTTLLGLWIWDSPALNTKQRTTNMICPSISLCSKVWWVYIRRGGPSSTAGSNHY